MAGFQPKRKYDKTCAVAGNWLEQVPYAEMGLPILSEIMPCRPLRLKIELRIFSFVHIGKSQAVNPPMSFIAEFFNCGFIKRVLHSA